MARGRMITNGICLDKRIDALSDDTSRLAFTWLVTFADCEGRTYGDPAAVRSLLFPRREDVSIERMTSYLKEWAGLGLIVWYEARGDQWIWFPKFKKNQPNLRADREPASVIPPPPLPEDIRQSSGNHPANIPEKRREENIREENIREDLAAQAPRENSSPNPIPDPSPDPAPDPPPQPTKKQIQDVARDELERYFFTTTHIPMPKRNGGEKADKSAGQMWWGPLRNILELVDYDVGVAKELIDAARGHLDKENLPISSPKSILKTAVAIHAKRERRGAVYRPVEQISELMQRPPPEPAPEYVGIWERVLANLRSQVTGSIFETCFRTTQAVGLTDSRLTILATPFQRDWIEKRWLAKVAETMGRVAPGLSVEFVVGSYFGAARDKASGP